MDLSKTVEEFTALLMSEFPPERYPSFNLKVVEFVRQMQKRGYTPRAANKTMLAMCIGAAWALEDVEAQVVKGAE